MISEAYWWLYARRNRLRGCWRELDRFEGLAPDESRRELGRRLLAQLQYFGNRADDAAGDWPAGPATALVASSFAGTAAPRRETGAREEVFTFSVSAGVDIFSGWVAPP